ncbi:hypothetical protein ET445_14610 [Agromyces protaetiae]|uniref:Uncharacterized protein n=1 Tax=Agromyces protaetiae TaxID=2509455 RepID=A0A4P6FK66_9MICO|nr:hypothetical protein [Agromyces protaetiae]QAY74377.1 hypothetical protein ET445_14610 [Agromyces protaetiae]
MPELPSPVEPVTSTAPEPTRRPPNRGTVRAERLRLPGIVLGAGDRGRFELVPLPASEREAYAGTYAYTVRAPADAPSSDDSPSYLAQRASELFSTPAADPDDFVPTATWAFAAFRLDAPLPHLVLDARAGNGFFRSNLPSVPLKDQRLTLEGDFRKHFRLYAPIGYDTDARYVLTPDVMARLIDEAAGIDVEIVEDWILFYRRGAFRATGLADAFDRLAAIAADVRARCARYRDPRVPVNSRLILATDGPSKAVIADEGRRLEMALPLTGL